MKKYLDFFMCIPFVALAGGGVLFFLWGWITIARMFWLEFGWLGLSGIVILAWLLIGLIYFSSKYTNWTGPK